MKKDALENTCGEGSRVSEKTMDHKVHKSFAERLEANDGKISITEYDWDDPAETAGPKIIK